MGMAPRFVANLLYAGKNITTDLAKYDSGFSYTDPDGGETDIPVFPPNSGFGVRRTVTLACSGKSPAYQPLFAPTLHPGDVYVAESGRVLASSSIGACTAVRGAWLASWLTSMWWTTARCAAAADAAA